MAIIKKTLFAENLDKYNTFVQDVDPNSKYFKITELSDTLTGGKNAFLIQGSEYLVSDTLIKIELKDASGKIIYNEPGEGIISSSINGEPFLSEYYEGVSKVVSIYIYPETAYGPCTLTILGELSEYDNNGLLTPIPSNWQGQYNVKWQKTINVNPTLSNTTKIRFYKRPTATITEILSPIYSIVGDTKVASAVTQSFANIKLSNLETFAGDVKRVKVFRTSIGDISDYDLIQDILVESKELLTSYGLSGSVVGNTGIFTSETLKNYWNTGSLNVYTTSSRVESGIALNGSGLFTYTQSLDLKNTNTYELNLDAFYSSSINSNLGIYLISGSTSSSITTLVGTQPTKNLMNTVIPFKLDKDFVSASLYFSQSQGEWHLGNISLKLSQDTAFSPDEISFITTMPTVLGNETFNFKFEFYDVNNNYVPVAVTQSALFNGGNTNIGGTILLISSSASSSLADLNRVSSSISGTMTVYSSSASSSVSIVSGSVFNLSGSVSTSVLLLTGSISSSLSSSFGYTSGSIYTLSGSVSASITSLSSSVSQSVYQGLLSSFKKVQDLADGNYSGSYISGNIIYAPVIGGQLGYFSTLFKVGKSPNSIYLDARQQPRKIFIGGAIPGGDTEYSGAYNNTNTSVYLDSGGKFSLGDKLSYDGTNLSVNGSITVTGGNAATDANALLYSQRAAASASISASAAQSNAASDATTKANTAYNNATAQLQTLADGGYSGSFIGSTTIYSPNIGGQNGYISNILRVGQNGITLDGGNKKIYVGTGTYANANTPFYFASGSTNVFSLGNKLSWNGTTLSISGDITVTGGNAATTTEVSTAQTAADNAQATANGKISTGGAAGDVNSNTTNISGGKIRTGIIESTGYTYTSGNFSTAGTQINLDNGLIRSKNFSITSAGDAFFKGDISGASGTFSGNLSGATITGGTLTVGTGNGRTIIDGTDFQTRFEDTQNDRTITIGPGGILIKGEHVDTNETPNSYWYVRQQDSSARMVLTSYQTGITPFEIAGYPQGNSVATIKIYNGGLYAQNYPQNYLDTYNGLGNGGYAIQAIAASTGTTALYVYGKGEFTGDVTANTSDRRLKKNVVNIDSPLEKLSKINGVYFNWNETAKELMDRDTEIRDIGFIAQEVQAVLPEIIRPAPFDTELDQENSTAENKIYKSKTGENYLTIQYEKIVPLLVECIKELKSEIEELKRNR